MDFNIECIKEANNRIKNYIYETPIVHIPYLSEYFNTNIYFKLENMQKTHSFKYRGAMNKLQSLNKDQLKNGVVCASSGNHGIALSSAAKTLGIKAIVVVPDTSSELKREIIKNNGAEVVITSVEKRFEYAKKIAQNDNFTLVPPYDDYEVMAGQGTIGLEILKSRHQFSHVFVPTSGGGLLAGVLTALKESNYNAKVIGVEPKNIPRQSESLKNKEITSVSPKQTIADALVTDKPGEKTFPIIEKYNDQLLTVSEPNIAKANALVLNETKIISEISSTIGIGSLLEKTLVPNKNDHLLFVISGGNIDIEK